jgi:hypothetical protein
MTESNAYWQMVVDALRDRGFRFRVKWSGDDDMTAWQPWVICPVPGYVETGSLGPVPVREVEWLDVALVDRKGGDKSDSISGTLDAAGIAFSRTAESIRVAPHVA